MDHLGCRGFTGPVPPPLWMRWSSTYAIVGRMIPRFLGAVKSVLELCGSLGHRLSVLDTTFLIRTLQGHNLASRRPLRLQLHKGVTKFSASTSIG